VLHSINSLPLLNSIRLTRFTCSSLFIFLLIFLSLPQYSFGQENSDDTDLVIRKVRFSGNGNVRNQTLENLIRTRTNREFLGINRFTPWYFVYRLTGRFGERPALLDRTTVAEDMERIKQYYDNIGYAQTQVDTTIVEFRKNRVEVSFIIDEGPRSRINTIAYSGLPSFNDVNMRTDFLRRSDLTRGRIDDTTYTVNKYFKTLDLRLEQERIISFLKDNGYAAVQKDSVIALVREDSLDPTQLDVLFRVSPGNIYRFGDTFVRLAGSKGQQNYEDKDTLSGPPFTEPGNAIYLSKDEAAQSRFSLMHEQIRFRPGDVFNNSLYLRTVNEYQNLGMLFIRRFGLSENTIQPDFTKEEIPVYFDLQTLTKNSLRTEFSGLRRYGFGTGVGLDFTNNNVFGKAEALSISARANFEFVTSRTLEEISPNEQQSSIFRSYDFGIDYSLPRLNFPFRRLDERDLFLNSRTRYGLSYSQSDQLFFDINSDIRFNLRYEVSHNERFSSNLDLIELDLTDTSPSATFLDNLESEFPSDTLTDGTIVPSLELQRIREDFRPQILSIIRYAFRSQRTDLIKRNYGYFSEYTISLGGNIPYLVDRYLVTPGTVEGNLPSLFGISDNSLVYGQFVKLSADYRRYIPISQTAVFSYRGFLGFAQPYANDNTIPLNQRFFAGGSNDIRGWAPFRLGPGAIDPDQVTVNGGDIKLAAFMEARQVFISDLIGADWLGAWFVDSGNVWYGPRNRFIDSLNDDRLEDGRFQFNEFYKQIAVGSGLGLRLDWEYIVLRFDFAFRVHDLDVGWFNNRQLYFSFGIGHSF
jgi:outer membrane protein assembly factor BamA